MPNWCINHILLKHPDDKRMRGLEAALKRGLFCAHAVPVAAVDRAVDVWSTTEAVDIRSKRIRHEGQTWLRVYCETAWNQPLGVYRAMAAEGWAIRAHYYEPGMGDIGTCSSTGDGGVEGDDYTLDNEPIPQELVEEFELPQLLGREHVFVLKDGYYTYSERTQEEAWDE